MDDLISRQAAIAHAISGRTRELEGEKWIRVSEVRESLQTMPSAERRGRWIEVNDDDRLYRCSACGELSCCNSPYCGECGAKMDEVEE